MCSEEILPLPSTASITSSKVEAGNLGFAEKLSYGVGNFAEMMVFNPATAFMVFFYTDVVGIGAATVGRLMLASRVFDLFNPVMGLIVDRTHSRHGKGRPWLLWLALPFGICVVPLFTVPPFGPTGKIIYAFITYNLALTIIYSAIDIPYGAMLPLITPDQHQRGVLSLFRMTLAMAGAMLSFAITQPMVRHFGGGAQGWQRSFMVFAAVATILLLLCFFGTKERIHPADAGKRSTSVSVEFQTLFANKYWMMVAAMAIALMLMLGLYGDNIYFCRYFLHDVNSFGPLMTMSQFALVVGMPVSGIMLKKWGKRNTSLLGIAIAVVGQATMFVAPTNFTVIGIGNVLRGLGAAPFIGTMFAMVADTVEYGEWKAGMRTEGLAYGTVALAAKVSVGLGNAAVGWILGLSGYVGGSETQLPSALFAIRTMFLHLPMALLLIIGLILWIYDLEKRYPAIMGDLNARRTLGSY